MAIEADRPTHPALEIEALRRKLTSVKTGYNKSFAIISAIELSKSKLVYRIADRVCQVMLFIFIPMIKLLLLSLANRTIRPLPPVYR